MSVYHGGWRRRINELAWRAADEKAMSASAGSTANKPAAYEQRLYELA